MKELNTVEVKSVNDGFWAGANGDETCIPPKDTKPKNTGKFAY